MNLPEDFIRNVEASFAGGKEWLANLPNLIEESSLKWGLSNIMPVSNLSFNFVAFAKQNNTDVILKIGVPTGELTSEMNTLKFFNGNGACTLLEHDQEKGFLLLERLKPGKMLSELSDDDERTQIAAMLLKRDDGIPPTQDEFIKLSDWFDGLKKIHPFFSGGTGPFDEKILQRVESELPDLFKEENKLLHGDFHHFNILSSKRGWLMIDPKGVIGPAGYEIGPFMLNPNNESMDGIRFKARAERRVDIFAEHLGWERESILQWALAHSVLSAWWDVEANLNADGALEAAKIFCGIK